jgi:hypothetical protein
MKSSDVSEHALNLHNLKQNLSVKLKRGAALALGYRRASAYVTRYTPSLYFSTCQKSILTECFQCGTNIFKARSLYELICASYSTL